MNKWKSVIFVGLAVILFASMTLIHCSGSKTTGDDDDQAAPGTTLSGKIFYEGAKSGKTVLIASTPVWPMTGPPQWYSKVQVPEKGFPIDFSVHIAVIGKQYIIAYLDVDPNDGLMMNVDKDPLAIPDAPTDIVNGEDNYVELTIRDDWQTDDDTTTDDDAVDDDAVDDDTGIDDDTSPDDDTAGATKLAGNISYGGSALGTTVKVCFYNYWPPMGPPVHNYDVEVGSTRPTDYNYQIDLDFMGNNWRIVAFLDTDPNDGSGYKPLKDPADMDNTVYEIIEGQTTTRNFTLADPSAY